MRLARDSTWLRLTLSPVMAGLCLALSAGSLGAEPWGSAKLKSSSVSYGDVGTSGDSLSVRFFGADTETLKAAAEALKSVGVSLDFFDDKTGEFKGIDNLVAQLDKLKNLDPQRLGGVLNQIAGGGQDAGFLALLAKGGLGDYRAMRDRMAEGADIDAKVGVQLSTLAAKWEAATGTFSNLLAAIGETMAPRLGEIVDWFNKISEAGMRLVSENKELFGWLGLGAAATATALVGGGALLLSLGTVAKLFGGISEGFALLAKIGPALGGVTDALAQWGPKLAATLGAVGKGAMAVVKAHPVLAAIFGAVALGFLAWDNRDAIKSGAGKLADMAKGLMDGIAGIFEGVTNQFRSIGADIVAGLKEGISNKWKEMLDWFGDLTKKLPQWVKDLLGIKSPSRVFMDIGEEIGAGLALGLENSLPEVRAAADKLAEVVVVSPFDRPRTAGGQYKSAADAARHGTGILGGLREYADGVRDMMDRVKDVTVRAFQGMEDALVEFVRTGKLNFKSLANSIIADLIRIQIQQSITKPLAAALSGFWGNAVKPNALGGVYRSPGLSAYSGQIVDRPAFFAFARGIGLMGEAGPEAIMPLRRGPDGRLGVEAHGARDPQPPRAPDVTIVINNQSGQALQARQQGGPTFDHGRWFVEMLVEAVSTSPTARQAIAGAAR